MKQQCLFDFSAPAVLHNESLPDISHVEDFLYSVPRSLVLLWEQRDNPNSSARKNGRRLELIVSDAFAHGLIDAEQRAVLDDCIRNAMPVPAPVLASL